jgi:hypothetical protein
MGIAPAITTDSWGVDSKGWLLAKKGMDTCRSITLNLALFVSGDGFTSTIPSGTVLGKVTASGLYGPYSDALTGGQEIATGLLFDGVRLADSMGNAFTVAGAAMLWEGIVRRDNLPGLKLPLPTARGKLDAAAEVDLKFIRFER